MRKNFPRGISDEEFLLRAVMPGDQVDAMIAAGPARRHYNPDPKGVLDLVRGLRGRPRMPDIVIEKPGFRLALGGRAEEDAGAR